MDPAQVLAWLLATVRRVTVDETGVQMTLSRSGLRTVVTPTRGQEEQDDLMVSIRASLTRCGGEIRLIVPGEAGEERRARPNGVLIKAVARAQVWSERLLSGEATSLQAIAREHGVTPRYVGRLLRCAFLAPRSSTRFFKVDSRLSSRLRGSARTCRWIGRNSIRRWDIRTDLDWAKVGRFEERISSLTGMTCCLIS